MIFFHLMFPLSLLLRYILLAPLLYCHQMQKEVPCAAAAQGTFCRERNSLFFCGASAAISYIFGLHQSNDLQDRSGNILLYIFRLCNLTDIPLLLPVASSPASGSPY